MLTEEFKKHIEELVTNFAENFIEKRYDKDGMLKEKIVNPMAVKTYFFNTLAEDLSYNPIYSTEEMNKFVLAFILEHIAIS